MALNRRTVLKTAGSISLVTLAGCTGGDGTDGSDGGDGGDAGSGDSGGGGDEGSGGNTTPSGGETFRIGLLPPLSGPLATLGQEIKKGVQFAMEYTGGSVGGHQIEVVNRDSKTDPSTGLQRAKELVESENVDAIVGPGSSAVGIAVIPYIKSQAKIPYIPGFVGTTRARELEKYCNDYTFYPFPSNRQHAIATVDFATNHVQSQIDSDMSSVRLLSLDYENGQSVRDILTEYYEGAGVSVEGSTMAKLNTKDWAPFITELSNASADVISGWLPAGPQSISFLQQASDFGLLDEKTVCMLGDATAILTLQAAGKAADGVYGTHHYHLGWENEINNTFKSWYSNNFDSPGVNMVPTAGFNDVYPLMTAIKKAGSADPDDLIETLPGMSFDSMQGELRFRESDHQTELNYFGYICEGGKRVPKAAYEDVTGEAFCSL